LGHFEGPKLQKGLKTKKLFFLICVSAFNKDIKEKGDGGKNPSEGGKSWGPLREIDRHQKKVKQRPRGTGAAVPQNFWFRKGNARERDKFAAGKAKRIKEIRKEFEDMEEAPRKTPKGDVKQGSGAWAQSASVIKRGGSRK